MKISPPSVSAHIGLYKGYFDEVCAFVMAMPPTTETNGYQAWVLDLGAIKFNIMKNPLSEIRLIVTVYNLDSSNNRNEIRSITMNDGALSFSVDDNYMRHTIQFLSRKSYIRSEEKE